MTLPKYTEMLNPVLKILSNGDSKGTSIILNELRRKFMPSPEELNERIRNGTPKFNHRMHWAIFDLTKANLIERVDRATYKISKNGIEFLNRNPDFSFEEMLKIPEYAKFRRSTVTKAKTNDMPHHKLPVVEDTPEENLDELLEILSKRARLAVLERLKSCSSDKFEQICLRLLVEMGYGGSEEEAYELLGKSHDGGVDGVIKTDKLGLENVYIQAKRYNNSSVGREKIQQFSGAIEGKATKGVMMTTSHFTRDAIEYAKQPGAKTIILIDGEEMAKLLVDYGLGVETIKEYTIARLNEDFFDDDFAIL